MKKKLMIVAAAFALLTATKAMAAAWGFNDVTVVDIEVSPSGKAYLRLGGDPGNKPTCATASQYEITGANSDHAKLLVSTATSAKLSGRSIRVYHTGNCSSGGYGQVSGILLL
jgi:hypothetical protein